MDMELLNSPTLALAFKALGDPTRLHIFQTLCCCARGVEVDEAGACRPAGSLSVGEVCCRLGGSLSTISHHLKELRLAGLIHMEKRGRSIFCSVNPTTVGLLGRFLTEAGTGCHPHAAVAPPAEASTSQRP